MKVQIKSTRHYMVQKQLPVSTDTNIKPEIRLQIRIQYPKIPPYPNYARVRCVIRHILTHFRFEPLYRKFDFRFELRTSKYFCHRVQVKRTRHYMVIQNNFRFSRIRTSDRKSDFRFEIRTPIYPHTQIMPELDSLFVFTIFQFGAPIYIYTMYYIYIYYTVYI